MQTGKYREQELLEDLFFGQSVIIWARWFVIMAAMVIVLWSATSISELTSKTLLAVSLMALNFFLHGRYLMQRPANQQLLLLVSILDLCILTLIVLSWPNQSGLNSPYFIFFYPLVLAFAFVFPPRLAGAYTGAALLAYGLACLASQPNLLTNSLQLEELVQRLVTLGAMGGLGAYYWRIQRRRRREALGAALTLDELHAQLAIPAEA